MGFEDFSMSLTNVTKSFLLLPVVFLSLTMPALASGAAMPVGDASSPPIGHVEFCATHPDECSRSDDAAAVVHLTDALWQRLMSITIGVNRSVMPVSDLEAFGRSEVWAYPFGFGDCEDYVLEKRRLLIGEGWPTSALLITVVRDEVGEGHAVLTVRTDLGDFVLDNRSDAVRLWSDTPYHYVKRQSAYHAAGWDAVDDTRPGVLAVGSN